SWPKSEPGHSLTATKGARMTLPLRIISTAMAPPPLDYSQDALRDVLCERLYGPDWATRSDVAEDVRTITRLYASSRGEHRQLALDVRSFYLADVPASTGERMGLYEQLAYPLARGALVKCLEDVDCLPSAISDFIVVSCTGYSAPGLDILIARD